eukprot:RCo020437
MLFVSTHVCQYDLMFGVVPLPPMQIPPPVPVGQAPGTGNREGEDRHSHESHGHEPRVCEPVHLIAPPLGGVEVGGETFDVFVFFRDSGERERFGLLYIAIYLQLASRPRCIALDFTFAFTPISNLTTGAGKWGVFGELAEQN